MTSNSWDDDIPFHSQEKYGKIKNSCAKPAISSNPQKLALLLDL
jgi:hypothetical protein